MLKMKSTCEKCSASLAATDTAFICSYECTFCQGCTMSMRAVCPNCGGELVVRPKRERSPMDVAASQVKRRVSRLFGHGG